VDGGIILKYDFNRVIERKGTSSVKWDYTEEIFGEKDIIPMWVADMDFEAPAEVIEALEKRAEHGAYGYTEKPESYYQSIMDWMGRRHGWEIKKEWICHSPGVVPALNMLIMALTKPGDSILVQSPAYHLFFSTVRNNGREILNSPLRLENGKYIMDYEELEKKLSTGVNVMFLSNPQNPVGRVWGRGELERLGELCRKYNTVIISDEIHSDLLYKGYKHTPLASISDTIAENTITLMAPSKTFNIAGLAASVAIISNKELRDKFNSIIENIGIGSANIFGLTALEAAYRHGEDWLEELMEYLRGNYDFLVEYIESRIPGIKVVKPEGTYLVWLDCRGLGMDDNELKKFMIHTAKIGLDEGLKFGAGGEGHQRMNIACPRSTLEEGLRRLEKAVNEL
jgi:cystathionine beta-lyase